MLVVGEAIAQALRQVRCFTVMHFDGAHDYRFGGEEAPLLAEQWRGLILDKVHTEWLAGSHTLQPLIWIVDIFYDRKRTLFFASNQSIEAALSGLEGAHDDLSRTLSRLAEMQSRSYRSTLDGAERSADVAGIAAQTVAQPG